MAFNSCLPPFWVCYFVFERYGTFPVFLRFFRFKSVLYQFSPFVPQIKNFCSDPGFFLLTMFAKDLTGCSVTTVLKVVITESRSASSLLMTVRGAIFQQGHSWVKCEQQADTEPAYECYTDRTMLCLNDVKEWVKMAKPMIVFFQLSNVHFKILFTN